MERKLLLTQVGDESKGRAELSGMHLCVCENVLCVCRWDVNVNIHACHDRPLRAASSLFPAFPNSLID